MKRFSLSLIAFLCLIHTPVGATEPQTSGAALSPNAFAQEADELLAGRYSADRPGGAVLVARGETILLRDARGEADVTRHVPLSPDSVFRIGSVTKQFVAAGLLTLVEAGEVELSDPLSKFLPDYPGGGAITVEQLLNHTSGVRNYTRSPRFMTSDIGAELTTLQLIDLFRSEALDFEPGTRWAYDNSGYVLVGAIIEAVTGMPWHAYLQQTLFGPLGMEHTGFGEEPQFKAAQVSGYSRDGDGTTTPMRPMNLTQAHAAGGLVSNLDDLLTWNRALHGGRVLQSSAYARMITPVGAAANPAAGYGFGVYSTKVRRSPATQHGGVVFGFTSELIYLPDEDISVVVLENDDDNRMGGTAANLARRLAALALGDPYPAQQAVDVDVASLLALEGTYRFDGDVDRVLRVEDGVLTTQRSGAPKTLLTPIGSEDFLYPDGFNRLKFERDNLGRISSVRLFVKGDGEGEIGVRLNDVTTAN